MIETIIGKEPPQKFFCRNCKAEITKEQNDEAIKKHWIPLCFECEPELKEKFIKWHPKFKQMKL